jgi:hypothetical protein
LACALLPDAAAAAGAPERPAQTPDSPADQQLDEILVQGEKVKPNRDAVEILAWLRRFVGQFSYSGYVDVRADGIPRQRQGVAGVAKCVAFGQTPGVHCTINVTWPEVHGPGGKEVPGGVSTLTPAMIQYGFDPDRLGVRFMQVDSRGIAERGDGYLYTNTLVTTTACVGIPGNCQRITRITPQSDGQFIETQIDIEVDGNRVVRYLLVMTRREPAQEPGQ